MRPWECLKHGTPNDCMSTSALSPHHTSHMFTPFFTPSLSSCASFLCRARSLGSPAPRRCSPSRCVGIMARCGFIASLANYSAKSATNQRPISNQSATKPCPCYRKLISDCPTTQPPQMAYDAIVLGKSRPHIPVE